MQKSLLLIVSLFLLPHILLAQDASTEQPLNDIFIEAESIDFLRSVLIYQNGQPIDSRYFRNATPDYPYNIKSASKSILSLLVGIAIEKGFIPSVHEPISTYFPDYFRQNPDSAKESITIKQLLSMQSGLESTSRKNYGKWVISKNWVQFTLDLPIVEEPGTQMMYSTGNSHLLSVILTKATDMSTRQFANQYLFKPLGIRIGAWEKDPKGYYMGGNNLAMKPADLMKIGQLILNKGIYKSNRIISEAWIQESLMTYGTSPINSYNYGYMWWNRNIGDQLVYFAWGFGGQFIFILPDVEAVVVITSRINPSDHDRDYQHPIFNLLEHRIIPALSASVDQP